MDDQDLRAMIRESIARRMGVEPAARSGRGPLPQGHASHALLPMTRGSDEDGACFIEPSVRCNHCNYCVSLGH
jgi:hypothetical protein